MTLHIRRVVTGHDADGKAVIIADGEAPRSWRRPSGLGQSLCWVTNTMPVAIEKVDNKLKVSGTNAVKMTDYGVEPPKLTIAGVGLKTEDEVKLKFEWLLAPKAP